MLSVCIFVFFFFSSRRRHTRFSRDWSSDVCSSDLLQSLAQRHQALLEAAAEQEAQLVALALEAERLAQRVQELESLGEEIWRLLGYEGPPGGVSTTDLGRGGPDDAFDGDVVSAALATVHTLARELPARFQELETLRET